LNKRNSFGKQRAIWNGPKLETSANELLDSSSSDIHTSPKKTTLLQKIFKGEGLGDILSNSFNSKHDALSIKSNHSHTDQQSNTFKNDHPKEQIEESVHSINYNSGHHQIQMFHFPDSQSREHWVTSNHRDHKHESLLTKIFHLRHDSDHEQKNRLEGDTRLSVTDETMMNMPMHTSTSSVEGADSRASVVSELRKQMVSPPPDLPKIERTFSNSLVRLISRKKNKIEDKEMTSNLIKEFVLAQNQISRTDTQTSVMTNASLMSSVANSDVCLSEKYGHIEEVLGKGSQATVRLAHLHTAKTEKLWAVKV
jgi:hypothetical protein